MQGLIAIFFRILNFFIASAIIWHYLQKYLVGYLRSSMLAEQQAAIALENSYDQLRQEQRDVVNQIENDRLEAQALDFKLQQWAAAYQKKCQERQAVTAALTEQKNRITQERTEKLEYYQVMQVIAPHIIQEARQQLSDAFADQQKGEQFVATLQTQLAKKVGHQ